MGAGLGRLGRRLALVVGLALAGESHKLTELGFALDRSASVGKSDFNTMLTALRSAIGANVPADGSIEITVVQFDSSTVLELAPTVIDPDATKAFVLSAISAITFDDGSTNLAAGIDLLANQMLASSGDEQLINIITDGDPCCSSSSSGDAVAAAPVAIVAGIDGISAEAVGDSVDIDFLRDFIVAPAPDVAVGDLRSISDPRRRRSVIAVADFAGLSAVIDAKVAKSVTPTPAVPELGGALVFGAGFSIASFASRRGSRRETGGRA